MDGCVDGSIDARMMRKDAWMGGWTSITRMGWSLSACSVLSSDVSPCWGGEVKTLDHFKHVHLCQIAQNLAAHFLHPELGNVSSNITSARLASFQGILLYW